MVAASAYGDSGKTPKAAAPDRTSIDQKYLMDTDDEAVTFRRVSDADDSVREVRISCPDATGLGCDIARLFLDFGLRILSGDFSTDGKWCFLILKVGLTPGMPAHWRLLKSRLEALCPSSAGHMWLARRYRGGSLDFQHPFLLQVSSYDRVGVLHDLMHTLWEADVAVYKAHITTSPAGEVLDMFWLYDNRHQLPDHHRVLEISDQVRTVLGQSAAECAITPAPADSEGGDSATATAARCACKDAIPVSPLARLVEKRANGRSSGSGSSTAASSTSSFSTMQQEQAAGNDFGETEAVSVTLDNATTAAYSMVTVVAADRKGLVYDLMRTMKDIYLRVAYAKVCVRDDGMCEADLFVQEVNGGRVRDLDAQAELVDRIKTAVALPVRISIKDVYDETCTELLITAPLDSGGRGRPRVTYDVTAALNAGGLAVFMADIYVEAEEEALLQGRRPQELHRFLVHYADGTRLASTKQKRDVYDRVRAQLLGANAGSRPKAKVAPAAANKAAPVVTAGTAAVPNDGRDIINSLANWKWNS